MIRKVTKTFFCLVVVTGLAGCTSDQNKLLPPDTLYPVQLLACKDEPKISERLDKTKPRPDTEKAEYIAGLRDAYLDCHDTVSGWKMRRDLYVKQYEETNFNYFERVWRVITNKNEK